jgi:Spy/CpxP family protein refolding chaperone
MHPAFFHWWKHARRSEGGCGPRAEHFGRGGGEGGEGGGGPGAHFGRFGDEGFGGGGPFGVRRPLRFLANRLELTEDQTADLARILNELKTERAQAEVDHQRTVTAFADAVEKDVYDAARAAEGAKIREDSNAKVKEAVLRALERIHALLTKEQRQRFAYLVRTGVLSM